MPTRNAAPEPVRRSIKQCSRDCLDPGSVLETKRTNPSAYNNPIRTIFRHSYEVSSAPASFPSWFAFHRPLKLYQARNLENLDRITPAGDAFPSFSFPAIPAAGTGLDRMSATACFTCTRSLSASTTQERTYSETLIPDSAARCRSIISSSALNRIETTARR